MKKVIMDVDTGIDDALAIAYAIALPEIDLLGITTSYGMVPVEYSYRNTKEVIKSLNQKIPVFKGSEKPLVRTKEYKGKIHGIDGLGETLGPVTQTYESTKPAVDFIIEKVHEYENELTIVTTGPLTNLASAIQKAPEIVEKVGRIVSMGGAVSTPGNVTKFAEANIYIDPEAANLVLQSQLPITLVGLDVTRKTLLSKNEINKWRQKGTKTSLFFAQFTEFYIESYKKVHPFLEGCALHDPLAVGVAAFPEIVTTIPINLKVDLEGETRGRTTEDLNQINVNNSTTDVCLLVDEKRFREDFLRYIVWNF
ncbi:nucleoside hydrolase [Pseudoneobacillus sp. C159]